jgi:hypothetical protein
MDISRNAATAKGPAETFTGIYSAHRPAENVV